MSANSLQGRRENSEAPRERERRDPLRAKRAENSQGLEINFGKLLENYCWFTLWGPQTLKLWVLWGLLELEVLGQFAPLPPSWWSRFASLLFLSSPPSSRHTLWISLAFYTKQALSCTLFIYHCFYANQVLFDIALLQRQLDLKLRSFDLPLISFLPEIIAIAALT